MKRFPIQILVLVLILVALPAILCGCSKKDDAEVAAGSCDGIPGLETCDAATAAACHGTAKTDAQVASIVFVGKKEACDCTAKRIDGTWKALQTALAGKDLTVTRLMADTEAEQVKPYREKQAMVTLPAVYFLDEKGEIVTMLQGELTAEAIGATLAGTPETTSAAATGCSGRTAGTAGCSKTAAAPGCNKGT